MDNIIQRAIAQLLINKAHQVLNQPYNHYTGLCLEAQKPEDCRNQDFEALAVMTDMSISSLKRFLKLSHQISYHNKRKLLSFFGYGHWDELIISVVQKIAPK
jgi:hypothetical protein